MENSINEICRACYSRNSSSEAWIGLIQTLQLSSAELELSIIDSLISLITSSGGRGTAPKPLAYLSQALSSSLVRPSTVYSKIHPLANELSINTPCSPFNIILSIISQARKDRIYLPNDSPLDQRLNEALQLSKTLLNSNLNLSTAPVLDWLLYLLDSLPNPLDIQSLDAAAISNEIGVLLKLAVKNAERSSISLAGLGRKLGSLQSIFLQLPAIRMQPSKKNDEKSISIAVNELVYDLVSRSTSATGAGSSLAMLRIYKLLRESKDSTDFWLDLFSAATNQLRSGSASTIDASFAYVRLPELIRDLIAAHGEELQLQQGIMDGLTKFKSTFPKSKTMMSSLFAGLYRESIITKEFASSYIQDFSTIADSTRAIATTAQETIVRHCENRDLISLASHVNSLVKERKMLDTLFLFITPSSLLEPIGRILGDFETEEDAEIALPTWGNLLLMVELIITRHNLGDNLSLHLGSCSWLRSFIPSMSAIYPSNFEKGFISSWITALFGDGISDELTRSTNPRILVQLGPTIVNESYMGALSSIITINMLTEGLNYFISSELLTFTLTGIIHSLINQIKLKSNQILVEIFKLFVFSPQLPPFVLEIVYDDLLHLSRTELLNTTDSTTLKGILGSKSYQQPVRKSKYAALVARKEMFELSA